MNEEKQAKTIKLELAEIKKNHSIKPGTPAMESYLASGYAPDITTREQAEILIADWKKDHTSCPYQVYQNAKAYLVALDAKLGDAPEYVHPPLDTTNVTHKSPGG